MSVHSSDVLCVYTACTHVGAQVFAVVGEKKEKEQHGESESVGGGGGEEEEEVLQPCPVIVFSVVSRSSPALWEYTLIPRDQGKEITQPQSHPPTSIIFSPPLLHGIPQTRSQIATSVPDSSSSPHSD